MYCRLKPLRLDPSLMEEFLIPPLYKSNLFNKKVHKEEASLREIESELTPYNDTNHLPHPLFKKYKHIVVEFCCGTGEFLVHTASDLASDFPSPDVLFIGVDYTYPCVTRAISLANQNRKNQSESSNTQNNILFYHGSAEDFLWDFQNFQFKEIMINFPDPWPKKKHLKRRIINHDFLKRLNKNAIKSSTHILTATDVKELHDYHLECLSEVAFLKAENDNSHNDIPREYYKYSSKYEQKRLSKSKDIFYTCHRFV